MKNMKEVFGLKKWCVLLSILIICLAFNACENTEQAETTVVTEPSKVDIGGSVMEYSVEILDLTQMEYRLEKLLEAAPFLTEVSVIRLGETDLRGEDFVNLQNAYPNAQLDYTLSLFSQNLSAGSEYLDASKMTADQVSQILEALPLLPQLNKINFVAEDGSCVFDLETIDQLELLRMALPEAYFQVKFDLFGQTVTSESERIEYLHTEIGNEGIESVRAVLPYLKSCTYFLMDDCGVDYEILAELRSEFPQTKIVWRIWLVEPNYFDPRALRAGSYLTDTHRVRTTEVNDRNSHLLNYCVETKYVDVGHVWDLRQCEFLSYMPELEVCILAITGITDITPLANHEKLEYLELFTTDIADISALASCPNLEHLNISNMPLLDDITPIYGLTKLKRLRMVTSPLIPEEQKEEVAALLPECDIMNQGYFPTAWRWRFEADGSETERYALLREQMEYDIDFGLGIP